MRLDVLLVYARPEPKSFNCAMKDLAVETLAANGHEVVVSDLYAMRFQPRYGRENFATIGDPGYFRPQAEERHALALDGFAPDIRAEMEKLAWCDLLIFQYPMWWFHLPAVLKGWVDRVFSKPFAYDDGMQFDRGKFRGKKAMLALTTGAREASFLADGRNGSLDVLLWPIQNGIFAFCGFAPLPPFVAYATPRIDDAARAALLERWRARLATLERDEPLRFHGLDDYDEAMRLKPGVRPLTAIQTTRG